jgi:hypothetical protein
VYGIDAESVVKQHNKLIGRETEKHTEVVQDKDPRMDSYEHDRQLSGSIKSKGFATKLANISF